MTLIESYEIPGLRFPCAEVRYSEAARVYTFWLDTDGTGAHGVAQEGSLEKLRTQVARVLRARLGVQIEARRNDIDRMAEAIKDHGKHSTSRGWLAQFAKSPPEDEAG